MRLFKRGGIPAGTVVEFWWRQMIPIIVLLGACGLTEIITPLTGLLQILSMVSGFLIWLVALMLVSLYYQRATLYTCARCGKSRRSYEWWVTYSTQHTGYCWTCWQDQVAGGDSPHSMAIVSTETISANSPSPLRVRVDLSPTPQQEGDLSWVAVASDWPGCTAAGESPEDAFRQFQLRFQEHVRTLFQASILPPISYDLHYNGPSVDLS